ncbi:MAG: protein kinase domain-containing protein [Planctomycetota bacterium]|jgi:serine/threonine protein kinase
MVSEQFHNVQETVPVSPSDITDRAAGSGAEAETRQTLPERIGPYHIEGELSRGGMGVVYVAVDSRLHRHVAIKMLPEHVAHDAQALGRLRTEARLLASLSHPNIATIYSLENTDGFQFFTLELIKGDTLAKLIAGGGVPLGKLLNLFRQVAEALQFAHESGVVHCDLKPANVLVDSRETAKVLDFGIARAVGRGPRCEGEKHAIVGTPGYMSPEQLAGRIPDERTDIWAFGCMLYEALAGRKAFVGDTYDAVLTATIREEPAWDALPEELADSVREIVVGCLEKNPARRLMGMSRVVEVLDMVASSLRFRDADDLLSRVLSRSLKRGDKVPHFELTGMNGERLSSNELLARGPLVISFYRGAWCPVCTDELKAFQERLDQIDSLGGSMVAVSPQLEPHNESVRQEHGLTYHVLTDPGNEVAKAYGVAFELPEDLRTFHRTLGLDLKQFNGDDSWVLPIPATFVVGQDGTVQYSATSPDPTVRPDPDLVVRALRELVGGEG